MKTKAKKIPKRNKKAILEIMCPPRLPLLSESERRADIRTYSVVRAPLYLNTLVAIPAGIPIVSAPNRDGLPLTLVRGAHEDHFAESGGGGAARRRGGERNAGAHACDRRVSGLDFEKGPRLG
jgi:hypothetical protein